MTINHIDTTYSRHDRLVFTEDEGTGNTLLDGSPVRQVGGVNLYGVRIHKKGADAFFAKLFKKAIDIKYNGETYTVNKNSLGKFLARTTVLTKEAKLGKKVRNAAFKGFKNHVKTMLGSKKQAYGEVLRAHILNFAYELKRPSDELKFDTRSIKNKAQWQTHLAMEHRVLKSATDFNPERYLTNTNGDSVQVIAPTTPEEFELSYDQQAEQSREIRRDTHLDLFKVPFNPVINELKNAYPTSSSEISVDTVKPLPVANAYPISESGLTPEQIQALPEIVI